MPIEYKCCSFCSELHVCMKDISLRKYFDLFCSVFKKIIPYITIPHCLSSYFQREYVLLTQV